MDDKANKTILVIGITGQQGGATARHLLAQGWPVRGLTRDLNKPAVQQFQGAGVEMVQGDMDDAVALAKAMQGVYGVFSVQNFWLPEVGAEGEVRQGKAVADAAKAAGVQHFVYTSVGGAERNTGIPHFESKWQIEEHIRALGLPATILRPVAFMDNYNWTRQYILNGTFTGFGLRPEKTLQLIAADDIGAFAAIVFNNPQEYIGKALELAGDELTEPQIAEVMTKVIGRPVEVAKEGGPMRRDDEDGRRMFEWFNTKGYEANIPALRSIYPSLMTLEAWLKKTGWQQGSQN